MNCITPTMADAMKQSDLNDICGTCLKNNLTTIVFEHQVFDGRLQTYAEAIHYCFNIQIQTNTYSLCGDCINLLSAAYTFKRQIENSLASFTELLEASNIQQTKVEYDSDYNVFMDAHESDGDNDSDTKLGILNTHNYLENEIELQNQEFRRNLNEEQLIHHEPPNFSRMACETCGKAFTDRKQLLLHFESHKNVMTEVEYQKKRILHVKVERIDTETHKPTYFECANCNKLYLNKSVLNRHMKDCDLMKNIAEDEDRTKNNVYQCSLCPNKSFSVNMLYDHYRQVHEKSEDDCKDLVMKDYIYYECKECQLRYSMKSTLDKHYRLKHKNNTNSEERNRRGKDYECTLCPDKCYSLNLLFDHYRLVHNKSEMYCKDLLQPAHFKCLICDKLYINKGSLNRHIKVSHSKISNKSIGECKKTPTEYQCTLCIEKCLTLNTFFDHYRVVHEKSEDDCKDLIKRDYTFYECNECDLRYYSSKHILDQHCYSKHVQPNSEKQIKSLENFAYYECNECRRRFKRKRRLLIHLQRFHPYMKSKEFCHRPGVNDVTCKVCNETFKYHKHLIDHMAVHFPNYMCDICGKAFFEKKSSVSHRARHNLSRKPCPICGKLVKTGQNLKRHIDGHEASPLRLACPKCPMRFANFSLRSRHLVDVHDEEPIYYKCILCPRQYTSASKLSQHTRSFHLRERQHKCDMCDSDFFSKNKLRMHMLIHSQIKSYRCEVCFKAFSRKWSVKQHMRTHIGK